jgi:hypothetical protein
LVGAIRCFQPVEDVLGVFQLSPQRLRKNQSKPNSNPVM